MPKISVLVPVYKIEDYLCECIDSILAQTFTDFELILVDDGSPDQSGIICDNYAKTDSRIKVIHQQNSGISAARNAALDYSMGDYITFVDSDDVISIFYLEDLHNLLERYDADIVVCDSNSFRRLEEFNLAIRSDIKPIVLDKKEAVLSLYDTVPSRMSVTAWGKLFKRDLFSKVRFSLGKIHEDQYIIPIVIHGSSKVVWIRDGLYGYRIREDSIMHRAFSVKRYDDIEAVETCIAFFNSISEIELADAAVKRKSELMTFYSLLARKDGIYWEIPKKYRISRWRAIYIMRKTLPYDVYSYRLAQIYPRFVSIEAYFRRFLQMIGLR